MERKPYPNTHPTSEDVLFAIGKRAIRFDQLFNCIEERKIVATMQVSHDGEVEFWSINPRFQQPIGRVLFGGAFKPSHN